MPSRIVFSDLDGTVLSHDAFSWEEAKPGLDALRKEGVPLILASSKTRREIESWRKKIGNTDPYIVENGGALLLPATWKPMPARARAEAPSSIAGERSIPITRRPVRRAIGTATRPFPTASSTTGPSASAASET